jgi:hypothetical protein
MIYKIVIESEGQTFTRIGSKEKCVKYLDKFKTGTWELTQIVVSPKLVNVKPNILKKEDYL